MFYCQVLGFESPDKGIMNKLIDMAEFYKSCLILQVTTNLKVTNFSHLVKY